MIYVIFGMIAAPIAFAGLCCCMLSSQISREEENAWRDHISPEEDDRSIAENVIIFEQHRGMDRR